MTPLGCRRLLAAALMVLCTGSTVAQTAPPAAAPHATAPAAPATSAESEPARVVSGETKAARAKLEGFKTNLSQIEVGLQSRRHSDADLLTTQLQIDPIVESIRTLIAEQAPRLEASKARLDQLGPKPKEGEPEESPDAVKDRAEREAVVAEYDETQRLARAVLLQAEQLVRQIGDLRRSGFARALFEQSDSILSVALWKNVIEAIPRELRAQGTTFADVLDQISRNATFGALLLLGLAVGCAVALYEGRRMLSRRFVRRNPGGDRPGPPLAAPGGADGVVSRSGAGDRRLLDCLDRLRCSRHLPATSRTGRGGALGGVAFIAFVRALIDSILAPDHTNWRLVSVTDLSAARIMSFGVTLATIAVVGKVLEAFNQAIGATLPITVLSRAVFALAMVLVFGELLRRFANKETEDEACLGPYVSSEFSLGGPVRTLGWIVVTVIVASVLGGYVALASFVVDQAIWISMLLAILILAINIADEFIGNTFRTQSRIATALQANTGLRRRSLEQIGVLANGVARLSLIIVAILLILAPWGVESTDLTGSVRAVFFGFNVGDVTISISSILIAALLFAAVFTVTRVIQRWLDNTFLPATDLDAGLRNSIRTAAGYVGIITAGVISFSYLGLSLERLTIVAGALSVGIGFGLQSIVNNFISGLILLWERPIRVGDLVVVGDGEGYVRRINVRSTEIQTADRSTLIVPNSNLISGVVRNRVRNDRIGRVLVSVPVPRASDPDKVAEIMRLSALAHREIMSEPAPRVIFKKVTENTIDFDLVCFVDDIDFGRPHSERSLLRYLPQIAAGRHGNSRPQGVGARGACGGSAKTAGR